MPENYWKTSAFLLLTNIWSCKMMYGPVKLFRGLPQMLILVIKLLKNLIWEHSASSHDWVFTGENIMHNWKSCLETENQIKRENWFLHLLIFSYATVCNFCLPVFFQEIHLLADSRIYTQDCYKTHWSPWVKHNRYKQIIRYILQEGDHVQVGQDFW